MEIDEATAVELLIALDQGLCLQQQYCLLYPFSDLLEFLFAKSKLNILVAGIDDDVAFTTGKYVGILLKIDVEQGIAPMDKVLRTKARQEVAVVQAYPFAFCALCNVKMPALYE